MKGETRVQFLKGWGQYSLVTVDKFFSESGLWVYRRALSSLRPARPTFTSSAVGPQEYVTLSCIASLFVS
jgi:hypothetical protein